MNKLQIGSQRFVEIYAKALEAGKAAAALRVPTPMVVGSPKSVLGSDIDPSKPMYYVSEGCCGFAWVNVKPGNSAFAKWLVKMGHARGAYGGGVDIWISDYGQSIDRKEAHAEAMARVLREQGIERAYSNSRMD